MTNEVKKKLDTIATRDSLSANNFMYKIDIPCWIYYKKSGDELIGKYYFVDLTDPEVKKIMEDGFFPVISTAQDALFEEEYYSMPEETRKNNNLIFISDAETKIKYSQVERDFGYIRKRFINESDLELFLSTLSSDDTLEYSAEFIFENKPYNLNHLNCIYGPNGSGKTRMMKAISEQFNSPLYSANIYSDKTSAELKYMIDNLDKKAIELYYKRLWDFSSNKKISNDLLTHCGYGEIAMIYIAALLAKQEEEKNQMLLIDDIYWGNFDTKRTLNAIEVLRNNPTPTVVTACTEYPRDLIRKRIQGSNIIEL